MSLANNGIKRCSGCQQEKSVADYYRNKSTRDGLNGYCKPCWKAKIDEAIKSGKHEEYDRIAKKRLAERLKQDEELLRDRRAKAVKRQRQYFASKPEQAAKAKARKKAHYQANKEAYLERQKARGLDPAKSAADKASRRAYFLAHKAEFTERARKYKIAVAGLSGSHTPYEWKQLCRLFGGACVRCGVVGRLSRDHVMPVSKQGSDNIENLQPLCRTCNSVKGTKNHDYRTIDKVRFMNAVGRRIFGPQAS